MDWIQFSIFLIIVVLIFIFYGLQKLYVVIAKWKDDWEKIVGLDDDILNSLNNKSKIQNENK